MKCEDEISQGKLLYLMTHELAHLKHLKFACNDTFYPPTPEKFLKEVGLYLDRAIYSKEITEFTNVRLAAINESIARKIFAHQPLNESEVKKIFVVKEFNIEEEDEEDSIPACDGRSARGPLSIEDYAQFI